MGDDLERVVLPGEPQIKIQREEEGGFSLVGGEGLYVPELPDAAQRARERMAECRQAIQEAEQRVIQEMDLSHQEQDQLLERRQEHEEELTFLSEFVSWAEEHLDV